MEPLFVCPLCGNSEPRYIGYRNGKPYCRKCVSFTGRSARIVQKPCRNVVLDLKYSLTLEQKGLSAELLENYMSGIDSLVYAVCGAGKTELTFALIARAMSLGHQVAFALPRRDVAMELYHRLKDAFTNSKVIAVYGDHSSVLEGDLIVLTTHQLYRYEKYFDLIIMDEIDAFPYKGNDVLEAMFQRALRGHYVLLSATPSDELIQEHKKEGKGLLELRTRFHKKPIPVPQSEVRIRSLFIPYLLKKLYQYRKEKLPCLVFVPSVNLAETLYKKIAMFAPKGNFVHSKKPDRSEVIKDFREGKYLYLITTAVLERGITIKGLQVIVFEADGPIYDRAALVQIAGRAGRKADAPKGEVIFLARERTPAMEEAEREIRYCNSFL